MLRSRLLSRSTSRASWPSKCIPLRRQNKVGVASPPESLYQGNVSCSQNTTSCQLSRSGFRISAEADVGEAGTWRSYSA